MKNPKFEDVQEQELALVTVANGVVTENTEIVVSPVQIERSDYSRYLEIAASLKTMTPKVSLTPVYYEFAKVGEFCDGVYMGTHVIKKRDENGNLIPILCIKWIDPEQKLYMNGGIALVSSFVDKDTGEMLLPEGIAVRITYTGKRGNCKTFNVELLG